mgnify:FL=1
MILTLPCRMILGGRLWTCTCVYVGRGVRLGALLTVILMLNAVLGYRVVPEDTSGSEPMLTTWF